MTSPGLLETAPTVGSRVLPAKVESLAKKKQPQEQKESIGERLSRVRRERGLTQVELAEKLGLAQPIISGYERDELRLHGHVVVELTRVLRVSAMSCSASRSRRAARRSRIAASCIASRTATSRPSSAPSTPSSPRRAEALTGRA